MPTARADVEKVALPPESVALPMETPASRNVTVPVGVPTAGATALTVAVKVTAWPNSDGFTELVTAVVLVPVATVCVIAAELLAVKLVSPA